ncbi:hypothetical protein ACSVI9_24360 [Pseudomonas aeruginosa]|uniref:hypothetical protein n=1 Tax=Pseudomonas aeruginosa TaxID=287 RepID=UPI001374E81D|nr:hypothetical protein [Pseudomonas aeruginosa]
MGFSDEAGMATKRSLVLPAGTIGTVRGKGLENILNHLWGGEAYWHQAGPMNGGELRKFLSAGAG